MNKLRFSLTAGVCAFLLEACSLGEAPGISGPGGSGSFVNVQSFSADKASVSTPGDRVNFEFRVDFASPSATYIAELYYNNSQNMPSPMGDFQITSLNCGSGSIYSCGTTGKFECTYDVDDGGGNPVIVCEGQRKILQFNGRVYFIIRACIYNENLDLVCDTDWTTVQIP